MATQTDIVRRVGLSALAKALGVSVHTVNAWATRNSIPKEHWLRFSDEGWATLDELARDAARGGRQ